MVAKKSPKKRVEKEEEVIDVNAQELVGEEEENEGDAFLEQLGPVKYRAVKVTKDNKDIIYGELERRMLDVKNIIIAILGAGRSVISTREQNQFYAALKAVDVAGEKVQKVKG